MKELDQFTFEQLAKWIDAGKEARDRHDGIRIAGVHVASLAKIALSAKAESEPHKRREIHAGGNTWIQCSKQAYDRAEAAGDRVRILYERPELNSPETPDGWVACSERMPGKYKEVVLWCPETKEQFIGFYDGREYVYAQGPDGVQIVLILSDISHWQPCAAAPKPEK